MTDVIDTQKMIGKIVTDRAVLGREDAIHIAVVVVAAGQPLLAGTPVMMRDGLAYRAAANDSSILGIVDPFLKEPGYVAQDEMFHLFVMPNTITNMRHAWEHPNFANEVAVSHPLEDASNAMPMDAVRRHANAEARVRAENWLRDFAADNYIDFDHMISEAIAGGDICGGTEMYDVDQNAFWENMEVYTGQKFDQHHRKNTYFSCAC